MFTLYLGFDDALSRLEGAQYFSIMDMQAGYWQVQMKPEDREKTAFIPTNGPIESYAFWPNQCSQYVPTNDGCLISRIKMEQFVYLDDIIIFSKTIPQHLQRLELVL
jgi:hypothetical protein